MVFQEFLILMLMVSCLMLLLHYLPWYFDLIMSFLGSQLVFLVLLKLFLILMLKLCYPMSFLDYLPWYFHLIMEYLD